GKAGGLDYRLAYVRLVEGAFYRNTAVKDKDQHFFVLDLNTQLGAVNTGIHYYGTYGKICNNGNNCNPNDFFTLNQTWIGPHATVKFEPLTLHGVVLANTGKIAQDSTNGFLVRLEGSAPLGRAKVSFLGIYSSGKDNGRGFQTVHGLLGTGGYWAYTYIFTPHGPSDVNDFGLEPGNQGHGLTSVQAKVDIPITERFSAQGVVGTFRSNKDMGANGKNLGTEAGITFTANLGKHMNLEFGGAVASLGDAGRAVYNLACDSQQNCTAGRKSVNELFVRLQMEF
ncbi:MAG: hypothetical protein ACK4ZR_06395, partial [Aquificaceae bacterium]